MLTPEAMRWEDQELFQQAASADMIKTLGPMLDEEIVYYRDL